MDPSNPRRAGVATDRRAKTVDVATLYLCRQESRWIVLLESRQVCGATRFGHAAHDSVDTRFELLSRARRACPEAVFNGTEGGSADGYEWRLEVRDATARIGGLGLALRRALRDDPPRHRRRPDVVRRTTCRRPERADSSVPSVPSVARRPLSS